MRFAPKGAALAHHPFLAAVLSASPLQPLYELQDHAVAMARNAASGLWGDNYGYDEERKCWWASDERGRQFRFVVEEVQRADVAA
jgi:hypothetical protein